MKIAHIFHHFNDFGGAEEHITTLAELQKTNGHEVCVCLVQSSSLKNQYYSRLKLAGIRVNQWPRWLSRLSGDWDTREAILGNSVFFLTPLIVFVTYFLALVYSRSRDELRQSIEGRIRTILGGLFDLQRERRLFSLLLAWKCSVDRPDIFHLHSYGAGLEYVLHWAELRNIPRIYQEHSTPDLSYRAGYSLPMDLNMANIVVAVSETSARALRMYCGVTRPIIVIPPIVSISEVDIVKKRPACVNDGVVQIITVARLSEEKGLPYLINAVESILPIKPHVKLSVYGEGPLRSSLEGMIHTKGLRNHIALKGGFSHDELPGIMSTADIFVLSSITEGLPLSLIEAMAWGLPIVATTVGGIPELIEDGVNGLLCPPENSTYLAEKLINLVEDVSLREKLGRVARTYYLQSPFEANTVHNSFLSAYNEALDEKELFCVAQC